MTERFTVHGGMRCVAVALASILLAGCDGSSSSGQTGGQPTSGARLIRTEYGRLVDIYAYRRIDPAESDRRKSANREPVLIARNIVVDPEIETEELFDSVGEVRPNANYRYLPFDVSVGHEELLILWDDRTEATQFDSALNSATGRLVEVSPAYRDQNVVLRPMPIVPRNAAIKLTFDGRLGVDSSFYAVNPGAIQVLRFRDDPNVVPATRAFEPAQGRIVADGSEVVVIDTSIIGGESSGRSSAGLRPSEDRFSANYRIAIPTEGVASRQLAIAADPDPNLNGVDSRGDAAVIRDFRSGNALDGRVGALTDFEAPMILAQRRMGILAVDPASRIVTLTKRGANLAIRARLPFVDGVVEGSDVVSGTPRGPRGVPTVDGSGAPFPLPTGDFLVQNVLSPRTGESVRIRAEILQVLEIGTLAGDANFPNGPGLTAAGTDGGELATVQLRLATISGLDSTGQAVTLQGEDNGGQGTECDVSVRYYEAIGFASRAATLSDTNRRPEFASVDPVPGGPAANERLAPEATIAVRFSEPLDLARLSSVDNMVLTNPECDADNFQEVLAQPKSATLNIIYSQLIDERGDGTQIKLAPPKGLFHQTGTAEQYWFHIDVVDSGVVDFAGNVLDVFDRRPPDNSNPNIPLRNWSAPFTLDADAPDNLVGSRVFRFMAVDEDGTRDGSQDFFGQFQLAGGTLSAAPVTRRSATADDQNLGSIQRWDKGECVRPEIPPAAGPPPTPRIPPTSIPPAANRPYGPGVLFRTPNMTAVQLQPPLVFQPPQGPQTFGGIVEPHTSRGARMQMTYREDDFGLDYHDPNDLNIDVEQLHWAPWNDNVVLFDRFDRYTMRLAHSKKRPDRRFVGTLLDPADPASFVCGMDCLSLFSGLSTRFDDNVLRGADFYGTVVQDAEYVVDPNAAFRAASGVKYVPYPTFTNTYTWRDHRLVSWDVRNGRAIGLGGAQNTQQDPPPRAPDNDHTASISSPWIQDDPSTALIDAQPQVLPITDWVYERLVRDQADFLGDRTLDHDPIALPLLVDIQIWPDDSRQVANAGNLFQIAYLGPIWPAPNHGYYSAGSGVTTTTPIDPLACTNIDWPFLRVYSFGGPDPNRTGQVNFLQPDREQVARGGVIKDMGLGDPIFGLFQTKPGDDHLHWAQIDFVRRVSLQTFGFFDTLRPNQHDLAASNLPGLPPTAGRPDLSGINGGEVRLLDLTAAFDPPQSEQPGGTQVGIEFRVADELTNPTLYDAVGDDAFDTRGNLLNPNYACEAFRYAMTNPGPPGTDPRVPLDAGISPYVTVEGLEEFRDPLTGLLPRFMNFRLVMQSNIASSPVATPTLRSLSIVYRVAPEN
jgi:hypothetical protein